MTLIEGDGIGPEISAAVIKVFDAAGAPISWEPVDVKPVKTPDGRVTVPEGVIQSMERNKIGLKGRIMCYCQESLSLIQRWLFFV